MAVTNMKIKEKLVEKILEQGQQLRNSMVESILRNDPFNSELIHVRHYNTPRSSSSSMLLSNRLQNIDLTDPLLTNCLSNNDKEKIDKCSCITCVAYDVNCLKCDLRRTNVNVHSLNDTKCLVTDELLKYVDSLKVILHSIYLNDYGMKKLLQDLPKSSQSFYESYSVEYSLPTIFLKQETKVKTGLENGQVRFCSRRCTNVIPLKKVFLHNVCNLNVDNLQNQTIEFTIKNKNSQNKTYTLLGISNFDLTSLIHSKNVSCIKSVPIYLNKTSPIIIGTLKATLQLGCGRVFFGKEFVDAVTSKQIDCLHEDSPSEKQFELNVKPGIKNSNQKFYSKTNSARSTKNVTNTSAITNKLSEAYKSTKASAYFSNNNPEIQPQPLQRQPLRNKVDVDIENGLLFGFIYVSEAHFSSASKSSYMLCQPYCQSDKLISKIVYNTGNPLYNFCQTVPLLYEDNLLLNLKDNFMVIEFWEKTEHSECPFGFTQIPLHQFYLAYRNPTVLCHLKRNKLPIVGTDWWEPIYSTENHEKVIGQVQILAAIGTQQQIVNLESERGFMRDVVKAKFPSTVEIKSKTNSTTNFPFIKIPNRKENYTKKKNINTVDVGVQSDVKLTMDSKDSKKETPNFQTQEMLNSFLKLLEERPRTVCVENGTNTDAPINTVDRMEESEGHFEDTKPKLRPTSDLLDSLQKALGSDANSNKIVEKAPHFKARILIKEANQLPSKRKIKSKCKRTKGKASKHETNVMPSTYVTFETIPGEPLQTTNVFPKSTSPEWNHHCNVNLPLDLLTNGQKRLIFKVWKKSTNTVLQPNAQTDLVLGFAALDVSVLKAGLPNVQGWFNIIDFSGKCVGQINIHIIPLENVQNICKPSNSVVNGEMKTSMPPCSNENNNEGNELLNRALKRKFIELEEITQRLRLRLSEVVDEGDSGESNDEVSDQFESDINNLCIEDDFDLVNFEEEVKKFSENYNTQKVTKDNGHDLLCLSSRNESSQSQVEYLIGYHSKSDEPTGLKLNKELSCGESSKSSLDVRLQKGKERIDNLLEKLSLVTKQNSQDITGCCSVRTENSSDALSQDSCIVSGSNINSTMDKSNNTPGSETSVITDFSDCRPNPVGQVTKENDIVTCNETT